jgi:hypothetical protein
MSSFRCEKCGKEILDTPGKGYITFCEHHPKTKFTKKEFEKEFPGLKFEMLAEEAMASAELAQGFERQADGEITTASKTKCANCGKTDYTEAIDFDDYSFCRECCEDAGVGVKEKFGIEYQDKWYKAGWEDCEKRVKQNIGLLRQYINELPEGTLLTNQQIEYLLFNEKQ